MAVILSGMGSDGSLGLRAAGGLVLALICLPLLVPRFGIAGASVSWIGMNLLGLAARPAMQLNSWDRTKLPRPFGKGCIVWDGPHVCPPDASDEDVERLSVEWAAAMTAACARAEAALAA